MTLRHHLETLNERLMTWTRHAAQACRRARTQQVDLYALKASLTTVLGHLKHTIRLRPQLTFTDIRPWLKLNGHKLALFVGAPIIGLTVLWVVHHQISRFSVMLALKPAQLSAIEALIYESKNTGNNTSPATTLSDTDLETMRVILQNRGINTNIFRLNLDQGVRIEIQADQVPFGQWVAFLEEIARRWQVYPAQLNLQANEQPESVSVRGTLQQSQALNP
jgi:type II secretory pathway component PulM